MPRTRLAPSPTGALHLGNARTFLVNWALARQQNWQIILRIEDLDGPRVKKDAAAEAIDVLQWLGLDWDEGPYYQRQDLAPYRGALEQLAAQGDIYPCRCTRREIEAASLSAPHGDEHELRYPGTCRPGRVEESRESRVESREPEDRVPDLSGSRVSTLDPRPFPALDSRPSTLAPPPAWRMRAPEGVTVFEDQFAGRHEYDIQAASGDFLVATKEGLPSYQLAVVVDDARQGIDRIVRGDDLLGSTHRQLGLQQRLGLGAPPLYYHLPLVVGEDGRRLAKRHGDTRISHYRDLGVTPARIIGLLGEWCGLGPLRDMNPAEFTAQFS
ncbi:MAG TPA: tRNA glutamyl-Q(34) synthetase GluQRS, partial [Lacipirellula sp.]